MHSSSHTAGTATTHWPSNLGQKKRGQQPSPSFTKSGQQTKPCSKALQKGLQDEQQSHRNATRPVFTSPKVVELHCHSVHGATCTPNTMPDMSAQSCCDAYCSRHLMQALGGLCITLDKAQHTDDSCSRSCGAPCTCAVQPPDSSQHGVAPLTLTAASDASILHPASDPDHCFHCRRTSAGTAAGVHSRPRPACLQGCCRDTS
jgi:hypothetical protein